MTRTITFEIVSKKSIEAIEMKKIAYPYLQMLAITARQWRMVPALVFIVLFLMSCSFQTTIHRPDKEKQGVSTGYRSTTEYSTDDDERPWPNTTPRVIQDDDPRKNATPQVRTVRRLVCGAFVPPEVPESPRVDLTKLRGIPGNDHEAVKNLLIDNIDAMNKHAARVEAAMKEAYRRHRATCSTREVVAQP